LPKIFLIAGFYILTAVGRIDIFWAVMLFPVVFTDVSKKRNPSL